MLDMQQKYAKAMFGAKKRVRFYRKVATLLKNGIPVLNTLNNLYKTASDDGKRPGDPMAVVIDGITLKVSNGASMAAALADWVPENEAMIISAGERAGAINKAMEDLIIVVEANREIRGAVMGSLLKPVLLFGCSFFLLFMYGTQVIPVFAAANSPDNWHGAARGLYILSDLTVHWWWTAPVVIVFTVTAVTISFGTLTGRLRVLLDRLPPWSIYRLLTGCSFLNAMNAMLKSGRPIDETLAILNRNTNRYLHERLEAIYLEVRGGNNFGLAMKATGHNFPDKEIIFDIETYSQTANMDEALEYVCSDWLKTSIATIKGNAAKLSAVAVLSIGLLLGWIFTGVNEIQHYISDQSISGR